MKDTLMQIESVSYTKTWRSGEVLWISMIHHALLSIYFSFLCIVFYVCFASAMLGKPCQELLGVLPVSSPDGQWQNWNGTCCSPGVTSYNRYVKMHYICLEKIKACLLTTWVETPVQGGRSRCARKRGPSQRFLHCFWIFWRVFQVVIQEEL